MLRWDARPASSCLHGTQCRAALTTLRRGGWSLRTRRDGTIPSWDGHRGGSAARLELTALFHPVLPIPLSSPLPSTPSSSPCSGDPLSNMTISFDSKEQAVAFAVKNGTYTSHTIPLPNASSSTYITHLTMHAEYVEYCIECM